jgi:hypothetical protein
MLSLPPNGRGWTIIPAARLSAVEDGPSIISRCAPLSGRGRTMIDAPRVALRKPRCAPRAALALPSHPPCGRAAPSCARRAPLSYTTNTNHSTPQQSPRVVPARGSACACSAVVFAYCAAQASTASSRAYCAAQASTARLRAAPPRRARRSISSAKSASLSCVPAGRTDSISIALTASLVGSQLVPPRRSALALNLLRATSTPKLLQDEMWMRSVWSSVWFPGRSLGHVLADKRPGMLARG